MSPAETESLENADWNRWRGRVEGRLETIEQLTERQVTAMERIAEKQNQHDQEDASWHEKLDGHISSLNELRTQSGEGLTAISKKVSQTETKVNNLEQSVAETKGVFTGYKAAVWLFLCIVSFLAALMIYTFLGLDNRIGNAISTKLNDHQMAYHDTRPAPNSSPKGPSFGP